jgi:hypothetical protein
MVMVQPERKKGKETAFDCPRIEGRDTTGMRETMMVQGKE